MNRLYTLVLVACAATLAACSGGAVTPSSNSGTNSADLAAAASVTNPHGVGLKDALDVALHGRSFGPRLRAQPTSLQLVPGQVTNVAISSSFPVILFAASSNTKVVTVSPDIALVGGPFGNSVALRVTASSTLKGPPFVYIASVGAIDTLLATVQIPVHVYVSPPPTPTPTPTPTSTSTPTPAPTPTPTPYPCANGVLTGQTDPATETIALTGAQQPLALPCFDDADGNNVSIVSEVPSGDGPSNTQGTAGVQVVISASIDKVPVVTVGGSQVTVSVYPGLGTPIGYTVLTPQQPVQFDNFLTQAGTTCSLTVSSDTCIISTITNPDLIVPGHTYAYEVMVPALGTNFSLQGPAIPGGSTPPYPDSLSQSGDVLTFGIVNGAAGEFPPTPAIVVLYDQSITVCQACR